MTAAQCGTPGGYKRHLKQGEKACGACRAACAAYQREWSRRRRKNPPQGSVTRMLDQADVPWLARMAPETPEPILTENTLAKLDRRVEVAAAQLRRWAPEKEQAVFARRFLQDHVGRSWSAVKADIAAALERAEADLEAAEAAVEASRERLRDYEGYVRVLRERHPELADSESSGASLPVPEQETAA